MIGRTVSHYRIIEQLGGGGMGVVYKAEDTLLKRTVALKFLPPALTTDPEARERFIHEARAASALDHSAICTVHEIGRTDDGQLFIVMACYEGETLKKKLEAGPLDIDLALDIAIQTASGLSRAHEAGIVHRDIKPANIMLTTRNEVKILDFGLAKLGGGSVLTRTGTTLGTAAYMSPEQARGETVDRRSDIWSLGTVLYELLTGERAFPSDYDQALVYSILNEEPKPLRSLRPEIPEVVEQIVGRALSKSPGERYQTANELLSDMKIARGVEPPGVTTAAARSAKKVQRKNLTRKLIVGGATAVMLGVGLFVLLPLMQDQALASHPRGIAFISLENRTGEPSLDYLRNVLPDVLGATLADSKFVRVTRSDRMRELMNQIGKDTVEFIDRTTGLLLCKRAGIDVMGAGSYTKAGPVFLTELELIDVSTGERLRSPLKARGREVESFLKEDGIVDDLARQVSKGLGVSQISTQAALKPVAEVSSSSMEAQLYYQKGKRELYDKNVDEARRFFDLAVKQDSTFAIAWYWIGTTYNGLGQGKSRKSVYDRAIRYAYRATERERFQIANADSGLRATLLKSKGHEPSGNDWTAWYKARSEIFPFDAEFRWMYANTLFTLGRLSEALPEYEKTIQLDPAFGQAYNGLGYCYAHLGQGEKAIQVLERYAQLQPGIRDPFNSMAECLMILGRYDEGIARCKSAQQVSPNDWYDRLTMARLRFMKEDYDEAVRWATCTAETTPGGLRTWLESFWWRAWYLIWSGRLSEAEYALRQSERKTLVEYRNRKITERERRYVLANISYLRGFCALEKGNWKEARRQTSNWSCLPGELPLSEFCLGLIEIRQGNLDSIASRRERIRDTLMAMSRRDTAISGRYDEYTRVFTNALEAAYLLAAHRPAEIVPNWTPGRLWSTLIPDSLTTASWPLYDPDVYGEMWGAVSGIEWIPFPFDILPRAYVERGMVDSAIACYERAVRKPPHFLGPIVPRYYYRLARLYEQKGMKEKAIEYYTTFLKVWGKADPVYREPADARARLARLKR